MNQTTKSFISILLCYIMWGLFPIYFKMINQIPAFEIIIYRIIFSFVFMILIIILLNYIPQTKQEIRYIFNHKRLLIYVIASSIFITLNWLTYVFSVNSNHILEASLGYYLNPIVTILLAVILLKEHLSRVQALSCLFVSIAILYLFITLGTFPWIALILALSFGSYGLCKKQLAMISPSTGLLLEITFTFPFACLYWCLQPMQNLSYLSTWQWLLIPLLGVITVIPLLFFAKGAQHVPLYFIGILQYVTPTMQFILAAYLYQEPLPLHLIITFILIWIAVAIFCYSAFKQYQEKRTD